MSKGPVWTAIKLGSKSGGALLLLCQNCEDVRLIDSVANKLANVYPISSQLESRNESPDLPI